MMRRFGRSSALSSPGNFDVEPSADTREAAHGVREMFVALVMEGFTENQALIIVGQILAAAITTQAGK